MYGLFNLHTIQVHWPHVLCIMYLSTPTLNISAETLKNIQLAKAWKLDCTWFHWYLQVGSIAGERAGYYCGLAVMSLQSFHFQPSKEMLKAITSFLKVTWLQAFVVQEFGLKTLSPGANCLIKMYFLHFISSATQTTARIKPTPESSELNFEDNNADCRWWNVEQPPFSHG